MDEAYPKEIRIDQIPNSRSEGEGGGFCQLQTCQAPYNTIASLWKFWLGEQLYSSDHITLWREILGPFGTIAVAGIHLIQM
jgi:hypothetical protein